MMFEVFVSVFVFFTLGEYRHLEFSFFLFFSCFCLFWILNKCVGCGVPETVFFCMLVGDTTNTYDQWLTYWNGDKRKAEKEGKGLSGSVP